MYLAMPLQTNKQKGISPIEIRWDVSQEKYLKTQVFFFFFLCWKMGSDEMR